MSVRLSYINPHIQILRWREAQYGNSLPGTAIAVPVAPWERLPGPFLRAVVHVVELHRRSQKPYLFHYTGTCFFTPNAFTEEEMGNSNTGHSALCGRNQANIHN